jgi:hypothetical protein
LQKNAPEFIENISIRKWIKKYNKNEDEKIKTTTDFDASDAEDLDKKINEFIKEMEMEKIKENKDGTEETNKQEN